MSTRKTTGGVVYVHSSPSAVCPHVEWAIGGTIGIRANLEWSAQPAAPGQLRAQCAWSGERGTAARIVAALKAWPMTRFEVTEDPSVGVDGIRYCYAPGLGLWHGATSASGDVMVGEDQLRAVAGSCRDGAGFAHKLDELLGAAWDEELEPYRRAGDGQPVTWLHRVG